MDSNWIHDPSGQNSGTAPEQILDVNLCRRFLLTPDEFGPETGSIGIFLKLSFHPYKEHPNPTHLGVRFSTACSWSPKLKRSRTGLGFHLDPDVLAGPPRLQGLSHALACPLLHS
jgi:hypothetical protein